MDYDLVIIGSGFAGLAAAKKAKEKGLKFCIVAKDAGATQHFSGAFDVIDPRWQEPELAPSNFPSLRLALDRFILGHPNHVYTRLSESVTDFSEMLIAEIQSFFEFYKIPTLSDEKMLLVFGSSGRIKPTAFTLKPFGLRVRELEAFHKALYVDLPMVQDYSGPLLCEQLKKYFDSVSSVVFSELQPNRTSPLASLFQLLDDPKNFEQLKTFLKKHQGDARVILMPAMLGIQNYVQNHAALEDELGIRVVELLSVFPSVAGLRLQKHFSNAVQAAQIPVIQGEAIEHATSGTKIHGLTVKKNDGKEVELKAKSFIHAGGKFIGGGISKVGVFQEALFQLPLMAFGEPLTPNIHISSLLSPHALHKQAFLDVGIFTNASGDPIDQHSYGPYYDNLKACGHILSGFDFTRDRCGFGMSVATAMQCF